MHCFITHVLLELEDLVLELVPQWEGEVVVILGHPRSASNACASHAQPDVAKQRVVDFLRCPLSLPHPVVLYVPFQTPWSTPS